MARPAWLEVQGKTCGKKRRNKPSLASWDRAGTEAALGAGGKWKSTSWDGGETSAKAREEQGSDPAPCVLPTHTSPSQDPPHPQFTTMQVWLWAPSSGALDLLPQTP